MGINELGDELRRMYGAAPRGEQATMIHLFGIKYAKELSGRSLAEVVKHADLPRSYVTEVNKGRNLARYVELKPQEAENARRRLLS